MFTIADKKAYTQGYIAPSNITEFRSNLTEFRSKEFQQKSSTPSAFMRGVRRQIASGRIFIQKEVPGGDQFPRYPVALDPYVNNLKYSDRPIWLIHSGIEKTLLLVSPSQNELFEDTQFIANISKGEYIVNFEDAREQIRKIEVKDMAVLYPDSFWNPIYKNTKGMVGEWDIKRDFVTDFQLVQLTSALKGGLPRNISLTFHPSEFEFLEGTINGQYFMLCGNDKRIRLPFTKKQFSKIMFSSPREFPDTFFKLNNFLWQKS